jgi:hypothetical protein
VALVLVAGLVAGHSHLFVVPKRQMAAVSGAERIPGSGNVNTSHIQTM